MAAEEEYYDDSWDDWGDYEEESDDDADWPTGHIELLDEYSSEE